MTVFQEHQIITILLQIDTIKVDAVAKLQGVETNAVGVGDYHRPITKVVAVGIIPGAAVHGAAAWAGG